MPNIILTVYDFFRNLAPLYYRRGIFVFNLDYREVKNLFPRGFAHMSICDPPFGEDENRRQYHGRQRDKVGKTIGDDVPFDVRELIRYLQYAVRDRRDSHIFSPGKSLWGLSGLGIDSSLITRTWDKMTMGLGAGGYTEGSEHIQSFKNSRRCGPGDFADPSLERLPIHQVIRCPRTSRNRDHAVEKPVWVERRLMRLSSNPGEIVFAPFGGCGTTAIAGLRAGNLVVIFEIDRNNCDRAIKRIDRECDIQDQLEPEEVYLKNILSLAQNDIVIPNNQFENISNEVDNNMGSTFKYNTGTCKIDIEVEDVHSEDYMNLIMSNEFRTLIDNVRSTNPKIQTQPSKPESKNESKNESKAESSKPQSAKPDIKTKANSFFTEKILSMLADNHAGLNLAQMAQKIGLHEKMSLKPTVVQLVHDKKLVVTNKGYRLADVKVSRGRPKKKY